MGNNAPVLQKLRFAVASFDTPAALQCALRDYGYPDRAPATCNCLALTTVLGAQPGPLFPDAPNFCALPLADMADAVICTDGAVADYLARRVQEGATTLSSALDSWLIPRHALQISRAVDQGKIVLFLQLNDGDDERRAYQALLVNSSGPVGVHDMIGS